MPTKNPRPKIQDPRTKRRGFVNILIVALIIILGLLLSGAFLKPTDIQYKDNPDATATPAQMVGNPLPESANSSEGLGLQTLKFGSTCDFDSVQTGGCSCPANMQWKEVGTNKAYYTSQAEQACRLTGDNTVNDECTLLKLCEQNVGGCSFNAPLGSRCTAPESIRGTFVGEQPASNTLFVDCAYWKNNLSNNKTWCVGKPVIYLYPEKTTAVDVKLTIPGEVYISIPKYPREGWKNVVAKPSGELTYQGKIYNELYYESKVNANFKPAEGIIIARENLESELTKFTTQLGLNAREQKEFLAYWLPKLEDLNKPYILFTVLTENQKESIDHVDISPAPDVFINFLTYFKGLDKPVAIEPLKLPETPKRSGFTAVEWGGTIDSN